MQDTLSNTLSFYDHNYEILIHLRNYDTHIWNIEWYEVLIWERKEVENKKYIRWKQLLCWDIMWTPHEYMSLLISRIETDDFYLHYLKNKCNYQNK